MFEPVITTVSPVPVSVAAGVCASAKGAIGPERAEARIIPVAVIFRVEMRFRMVSWFLGLYRDPDNPRRRRFGWLWPPCWLTESPRASRGGGRTSRENRRRKISRIFYAAPLRGNSLNGFRILPERCASHLAGLAK